MSAKGSHLDLKVGAGAVHEVPDRAFLHKRDNLMAKGLSLLPHKDISGLESIM